VTNQKTEIEQRLLRSQLNPHFIFNAISSIQNYLFDRNDLSKALTYMSKLADLMRQILENSREENVTLSEEINTLNNYLALQQLRYNNQFGFHINVGSAINTDELLVPPLIAQPFVENAIEHGMIYRKEDGEVIINFDLRKDELVIKIKDNGKGFETVDKTSKVVSQKKKSLSTQITKERLKYISKLSNKKFHLLINSITGSGTEVTINLPILFN
jgi:LytS/YehU family sensor histidine kinase